MDFDSVYEWFDCCRANVQGWVVVQEACNLKGARVQGLWESGDLAPSNIEMQWKQEALPESAEAFWLWQGAKVDGSDAMA